VAVQRFVEICHGYRCAGRWRVLGIFRRMKKSKIKMQKSKLRCRVVTLFY
jgi:hypothetical protein